MGIYCTTQSAAANIWLARANPANGCSQILFALCPSSRSSTSFKGLDSFFTLNLVYSFHLHQLSLNLFFSSSTPVYPLHVVLRIISTVVSTDGHKLPAQFQCFFLPSCQKSVKWSQETYPSVCVGLSWSSGRLIQHSIRGARQPVNSYTPLHQLMQPTILWPSYH